MSNLLRQSMNPPRPRPDPISIQETDEPRQRSDSSSSSADSEASINTIRAGSREQAAPPTHWNNYFSQELFLEDNNSDGSKATYHVYLTPPKDIKKGPLFICHHGAGSSGLSFALFATQLQTRLPEAGILSLEARAHGSTITSATAEEAVNFSISTLASDAENMIALTKTHLSWPTLPPTVLVGHSLGGAVVTELAYNDILGPSLIGFCVVDVVEGYAMEALSHMRAYLAARPSIFNSADEAITWHTRSRTIRNPESAAISVPSLLVPTPSGDGKLTWRTDLNATPQWWEDWFGGMSQKFLRGRGAKMLVLAGTDRLDKDLMIGQMQGKFQLVVVPEAGHFVQEDVPERTADLVVEFFRRNDRSALVLPPKVSELLAQGKKV